MLVISMAFWGGTWIAGRILGQTLSPWSSAFLRFVLASAALAALCLRTRGKKGFRMQRRHILPLIMLGITGILAYSTLFFNGLRTIGASRAAMIVGCTPVCIALTSTLIARERFTLLTASGILLSLTGVSVVISNGNPASLLTGDIQTGDLMILGCVVCWTAYTLIGKPLMKQLPPLTVTMWACILGAAMLFPFAVVFGLWEDILEARQVDWLALIYLGLLATALAYYWYYRAVNTIGATRSAIFINLVPLFALLLGVILLNEKLHISLLIGGAMVIAGVCLTVYSKSRHGRSEAPIAADY